MKHLREFNHFDYLMVSKQKGCGCCTECTGTEDCNCECEDCKCKNSPLSSDLKKKYARKLRSK